MTEETRSVAVERSLSMIVQTPMGGDLTPITVRITSTSGWVPVRLREIWEYRELLYFLARREMRVRYRQTILGPAWALLKPLCLVVIFSVVFGWLVHVPSDGLPYPLFTLCAILPWQLFAHTLMGVSQSLVSDQNLLTKVYFPRLILPLATLITGLVDFAIATSVLFGLMVYFGVLPTPYIWCLPLFMLLAISTSLGLGLWCSALNVRYRDVGHALPFLIQLWFFVTPIAYPSSLIPQMWRNWFGLNPMVSVVEGFRWCLLGTGAVSITMVFISALISAGLLFSGLIYFRQVEQTFADVV